MSYINIASNIIPIILFIILFMGLKPIYPMSFFNADYLSLNTTKCIKGLFAIIIVFVHLAPKVSSECLTMKMFKNIGFLPVSFFFFLSGYGMLKSYMEKPNYGNGFLLKRIPKICIPYIIATAVYYNMKLYVGGGGQN